MSNYKIGVSFARHELHLFIIKIHLKLENLRIIE